MTIKIIITSLFGIACGHFFKLDFSSLNFNIIDTLNYLILLTTGLSIGYGGNIRENLRRSGIDIIFVPIIVIVGGILGAIAASFFLRENMLDTIIKASPLGWYTFGGATISKYDIQSGAIAFLSSMMREFLGITTAPIVAKKIGYLETIVTCGATSGYTCLAPISKATDNHTTITAFMNGMILTLIIPMLVQFLLMIKFGD